MHRVHRRARRAALTLGVLGTGSALVLGAVPAQAAAPANPTTTVAGGLITPLKFAFSPGGNVWVGQSFAGLLTRITPKGQRTNAVAAAPAAVISVSVGPGGTYFTENTGNPEAPGDFGAILKKRTWTGTTRTIADLGAFEKKHNPDRRATYGFPGLPKTCAAKLPKDFGPASHRGELNSNPYGAAVNRNGTVFVADAGANALLKVSKRGHIRVLAVLPRVPVKITKALAKEQKLPTCLVGRTFYAEPVPTDVEFGPHGRLYVSSLPGGIEGSKLIKPGGVLVYSRSGKLLSTKRGFGSAVDLAVTSTGKVYVADLFGGKINKLDRGRITTVATVTQPGAVELFRGRLYATTHVLSEGPTAQLVRFAHR